MERGRITAFPLIANLGSLVYNRQGQQPNAKVTMTHHTRLSVTPLSPFNFEFTATSHGWVDLAPTTWDEERHAVQRVERLSDGRVVLLHITGAGSIERPKISVEVGHPGRLSPRQQKEIKTIAGRIFRADEDLSEFYALCKKRGKRWARMTAGLGRLFRSPTVFEDVVKTICTTNIQWGGTRGIVKRLVDTYGEPYSGDSALRAFPAPEAIASAPFKRFAESVRAGYRNEYIHTLAGRVASGELDLEVLRDSNLPTPELKKKLLAIKGVGNYAAATLLMLLGHYDELAVDTVFREFVSKTYFDRERPSDHEAQAVYERWGRWKYLAYWFDIWLAWAEGQKKEG
jgi:3-methyladenine DNA glycosylase/8-oxoguanine DNA glycosylase